MEMILIMLLGGYFAACVLGAAFNWWADKSLENEPPKGFTKKEWKD